MTTETVNVKKEEEIPQNFTGLVVFANGNKFHLVNGQPHRDNGPAKEYSDGTQKWYLMGKLVKKAMLQTPKTSTRSKKWSLACSFDNEQDFCKFVEDVYNSHVKKP